MPGVRSLWCLGVRAVDSTVCQLDKLEVGGFPDETFNIKIGFWTRVFGGHHFVLRCMYRAKLCMGVSGRVHDC